MGEIHSGTLLTTPELRGSAGNCSELGVDVGGEVVGFSRGDVGWDCINESHRSAGGTCHPRRICIVLQLLSATRFKPCVSYPVILSVTFETGDQDSFFTENIRSQQLKGTVIRPTR